MLLPNFNDSYYGAAPDVGAYENGDLLMITGVGGLSPVPLNTNRIIAGKGENEKIVMTQSDKKEQSSSNDEKNVISTSIHTLMFPNPATNVTTILFSLSKSQHVSIRAFDMMGTLIKTLAEGKIEAGVHQLTWDLRDEKGRYVNTGIYFLKINSGNSMETKKLCVLH
jgi:hypothetical protein